MDVDEKQAAEIRVSGYDVRIVPWPNYSELTLEPWFTVNVRGPAGSFWPQHNGQRFAQGNEIARMERKQPGLADIVEAEVARRLALPRFESKGA